MGVTVCDTWPLVSSVSFAWERRMHESQATISGWKQKVIYLLLNIPKDMGYAQISQEQTFHGGV